MYWNTVLGCLCLIEFALIFEFRDVFHTSVVILIFSTFQGKLERVVHFGRSIHKYGKERRVTGAGSYFPLVGIINPEMSQMCPFWTFS